MSRKIVLLFAGQGAQRVGMGKDLAAKFPIAEALFRRADEVLGMELSQVMFEGPLETLTRTSYCQPALFVHGLACWKLLQELLPGLEVAAGAGLSLGEFTAHAAAGTFSFTDGLRLVAARGRFMDEACDATDGAMAAMIGGEETAVRELALECDIDVANLNSPGQIVLSGSREGVAQAIERAKSKGIRAAKPLQVAGAYHSRLMQSAREKLAHELAQVEFQPPRLSVISNVTAQPVISVDEIRQTLEAQVTSPVRWSESMTYLFARGYRLFVEAGPGRVLAGLLGRIDKSARVLCVEDVTSIEEAAAEIAKLA